MILNFKSSLIQVITSTLDKQFEIKSIQDDKFHEKKNRKYFTHKWQYFFFLLHPCDLCFMVRIDFNFFSIHNKWVHWRLRSDAYILSIRKYSNAFLSFFFFKCYICAFLLIKTKLLPLRTIQIIDNSASYLADRSGLANKSITYFMIFRMHSTYFPNVWFWMTFM